MLSIGWFLLSNVIGFSRSRCDWLLIHLKRIPLIKLEAVWNEMTDWMKLLPPWSWTLMIWLWKKSIHNWSKQECFYRPDWGKQSSMNCRIFALLFLWVIIRVWSLGNFMDMLFPLFSIKQPQTADAHWLENCFNWRKINRTRGWVENEGWDSMNINSTPLEDFDPFDPTACSTLSTSFSTSIC